MSGSAAPASEPLRRFLQVARGAGLRVSAAEGIDAARAVDLVGFSDRALLKDALGLILAKRTAPPVEGLEGLVEAGWIDPCFPDAARGVPWLGWVTPRD